MVIFHGSVTAYQRVMANVMPQMSKHMIFLMMVGRYCGSNSVISTGPAAARSGQAILGKVKRLFFQACKSTDIDLIITILFAIFMCSNYIDSECCHHGFFPCVASISSLSRYLDMG